MLQQMARPAESVDAYREAMAAAETSRERCNAWIGIAAGVRLSGGVVDGMAALNEAEALTMDGGFDRERARFHLQKRNFSFTSGEIDLCLAHQKKSLEHAERAENAELQARALGGLGDAYYARCLSMPLFAGMEEGDVDRTVEALGAVLGLGNR